MSRSFLVTIVVVSTLISSSNSQPCFDLIPKFVEFSDNKEQLKREITQNFGLFAADLPNFSDDSYAGLLKELLTPQSDLYKNLKRLNENEIIAKIATFQKQTPGEKKRNVGIAMNTLAYGICGEEIRYTSDIVNAAVKIGVNGDAARGAFGDAVEAYSNFYCDCPNNIEILTDKLFNQFRNSLLNLSEEETKAKSTFINEKFLMLMAFDKISPFQNRDTKFNDFLENVKDLATKQHPTTLKLAMKFLLKLLEWYPNDDNTKEYIGLKILEVLNKKYYSLYPKSLYIMSNLDVYCNPQCNFESKQGEHANKRKALAVLVLISHNLKTLDQISSPQLGESLLNHYEEFLDIDQNLIKNILKSLLLLTDSSYFGEAQNQSMNTDSNSLIGAQVYFIDFALDVFCKLSGEKSFKEIFIAFNDALDTQVATDAKLKGYYTIFKMHIIQKYLANTEDYTLSFKFIQEGAEGAAMRTSLGLLIEPKVQFIYKNLKNGSIDSKTFSNILTGSYENNQRMEEIVVDRILDEIISAKEVGVSGLGFSLYTITNVFVKDCYFFTTKETLLSFYDNSSDLEIITLDDGSETKLIDREEMIRLRKKCFDNTGTKMLPLKQFYLNDCEITLKRPTLMADSSKEIDQVSFFIEGDINSFNAQSEFTKEDFIAKIKECNQKYNQSWSTQIHSFATLEEDGTISFHIVSYIGKRIEISQNFELSLYVVTGGVRKQMEKDAFMKTFSTRSLELTRKAKESMKNVKATVYVLRNCLQQRTESTAVVKKSVTEVPAQYYIYDENMQKVEPVDQTAYLAKQVLCYITLPKSKIKEFEVDVNESCEFYKGHFEMVVQNQNQPQTIFHMSSFNNFKVFESETAEEFANLKKQCNENNTKGLVKITYHYLDQFGRLTISHKITSPRPDKKVIVYQYETTGGTLEAEKEDQLYSVQAKILRSLVSAESQEIQKQFDELQMKMFKSVSSTESFHLTTYTIENCMIRSHVDLYTSDIKKNDDSIFFKMVDGKKSFISPSGFNLEKEKCEKNGADFKTKNVGRKVVLTGCSFTTHEVTYTGKIPADYDFDRYIQKPEEEGASTAITKQAFDQAVKTCADSAGSAAKKQHIIIIYQAYQTGNVKIKFKRFIGTQPAKQTEYYIFVDERRTVYTKELYEAEMAKIKLAIETSARQSLQALLASSTDLSANYISSLRIHDCLITVKNEVRVQGIPEPDDTGRYYIGPKDNYNRVTGAEFLAEKERCVNNGVDFKVPKKAFMIIYVVEAGADTKLEITYFGKNANTYGDEYYEQIGLNVPRQITITEYQKYTSTKKTTTTTNFVQKAHVRENNSFGVETKFFFVPQLIESSQTTQKKESSQTMFRFETSSRTQIRSKYSESHSSNQSQIRISGGSQISTTSQKEFSSSFKSSSQSQNKILEGFQLSNEGLMDDFNSEDFASEYQYLVMNQKRKLNEMDLGNNNMIKKHQFTIGDHFDRYSSSSSFVSGTNVKSGDQDTYVVIDSRRTPSQTKEMTRKEFNQYVNTYPDNEKQTMLRHLSDERLII